MTISKWKVLSSKTLHKDSWVHLRVDEVDVGKGKTLSPYYVLNSPDWAAIIAFSEKGEILLQQQYRHGLGEILWELPGGTIDHGESPLIGITREFLEETGCQADTIHHLITLTANPSTQTNRAHFFVGKDCKKVQEASLSDGEEIETRWFSIKEIYDLIDRGEFIQGVHLGALLLCLRKMSL